MCGEELPGRAVRRLIAIDRDDARQSALTLERPLKECLRRSDIPLRAQQKIDRLSSTVDSTIEISPAAFDLHVSFVDPPRPASFTCDPVWIQRMMVVCARSIPRSAIIST